jgi:hypothetical protein
VRGVRAFRGRQWPLHVLSTVRRAKVVECRAVLHMCVAGSCPEIDRTYIGGGPCSISAERAQAAARSVSRVLFLVRACN